MHEALLTSSRLYGGLQGDAWRSKSFPHVSNATLFDHCSAVHSEDYRISTGLDHSTSGVIERLVYRPIVIDRLEEDAGAANDRIAQHISLNSDPDNQVVRGAHCTSSRTLRPALALLSCRCMCFIFSRIWFLETEVLTSLYVSSDDLSIMCIAT